MANNQGNILVSAQSLKDTASAYRNNIAKMRNLLEEATTNINKTSSFWTGDAAESLRLKYEKLKANFEPFCQNVEEFAKFLDNSAEDFSTTESNITRAAEETISDINL